MEFDVVEGLGFAGVGEEVLGDSCAGVGAGEDGDGGVLAGGDFVAEGAGGVGDDGGEVASADVGGEFGVGDGGAGGAVEEAAGDGGEGGEVEGEGAVFQVGEVEFVDDAEVAGGVEDGDAAGVVGGVGGGGERGAGEGVGVPADVVGGVVADDLAVGDGLVFVVDDVDASGGAGVELEIDGGRRGVFGDFEFFDDVVLVGVGDGVEEEGAAGGEGGDVFAPRPWR